MKTVTLDGKHLTVRPVLRILKISQSSRSCWRDAAEPFKKESSTSVYLTITQNFSKFIFPEQPRPFAFNSSERQGCHRISSTQL